MVQTKFPYKQTYDDIHVLMLQLQEAYPKDGLRNFQLLEVLTISTELKDKLQILIDYIISRDV